MQFLGYAHPNEQILWIHPMNGEWRLANSPRNGWRVRHRQDDRSGARRERRERVYRRTEGGPVESCEFQPEAPRFIDRLHIERSFCYAWLALLCERGVVLGGRLRRS